MNIQQLITFLSQYSIKQINPQTYIISTNPNNNNNNQNIQKNNLSSTNINQQNQYLIKDMLIPQNQYNSNQSQNHFENILETLKLHKKLNNKYILTLLHYQIFTKNITLQIPQTTQHKNHSQSHLNKSNLNKHKNTQLYDTNSPINSQQSLSQSQSNELISQITTTTTFPQRAIRAIYEYTPLTLQQQILNRKSSQTNFQQEQLWAIIATITQALTYLQSQNIIYGVLGTDKIFINNSLVKIIDPSATATDPLLIQQGRLYSPEILNRQENQDIDLFKSDIYVLGLMMLECGLLTDLTREIEQDLTRFLQGFRTIYSQQLANVIEQCLAHCPQDRPCFQQLQDYLTRQLDMNDFSNAYENGNQEENINQWKQRLIPLENDSEDPINQEPMEIQVQNKNVQQSYDVLYQRQDQKQIKIKGCTAFERAKYKFIRGQNQQEQVSQENDSSSQQEITKQRLPLRCKSPHNPLRTQSPKLQQTQRNIPKTTNTNIKSKFLSISKQPNFYPSINSINAKISESVYGEELPIYHTDLHQSQRNKNFQQKLMPKQPYLKNMQKIKKTKLIKEKLIKNYQNLHQEHSFTNQNDNILSQNTHIINTTRIPQQYQNNHKDNQKSTRNKKEKQYFKYDHTGNSIQQELQEESQNSCLYYNYNTNASKNWKFSQNGNNNQNTTISQNIQTGTGSKLPKNPTILENTKNNKKSLTKQNQSQINKINLPIFNKHNEKEKFINNNQHIFTDPILMKTIKQDMQIFIKNKKQKLI